MCNLNIHEDFSSYTKDPFLFAYAQFAFYIASPHSVSTRLAFSSCSYTEIKLNGNVLDGSDSSEIKKKGSGGIIILNIK